ncbi:MAG: methylenetetrahydrofolate--tRNA-(uracil(54)-C(5))-methyltransferase (FADH(2)-oxidizing) TrmFO [Synergistaceae bacterium]|jgi:methylenetetrahydrofolate--tRNA-(uracil-5-)-methyltransferase|nr:methylenetetrahydrofolate--tRNA-(uracil(54)-C(5))-methyltransferase (FADH(2)-oxidizing) TrmFO [Synergistaceae bacterium]
MTEKIRRVGSNEAVTVAGGGLAGSEAAWQLASRGIRVKLFEMRPVKKSPAHSTGELAELVCSNSLGADRPTSPAGILKEELRKLGSLIMSCAEKARVPAGGALAVDGRIFSGLVTEAVTCNPNIELIREEVCRIPEGPAILAVGPLMGESIARSIKDVVGEDCLSFFDAAAPIVTLDSVDMNRAYRAGRYGQCGDYINCPLDKEQYEAFQRELASAERAQQHIARGTKKPRYFEGCLPVEVMAERGLDTLRYGPMRPVGLPDPSNGKIPYAVVQLRRSDAEGTLYGMVGFQTNLKWPEQDRVFRMIPALENAELVRKGVMHENAFVCAPRVLDRFMRPRNGGVVAREDLFLAGQITGVEGYVESTASGLAAALNMSALLLGRPMPEWPAETAIGSLLRYLSTAEPKSFQPMNVNLGIFPPFDDQGLKKLKKTPGGKKLTKQERSLMFAERSAAALEKFLDENSRNACNPQPDIIHLGNERRE